MAELAKDSQVESHDAAQESEKPRSNSQQTWSGEWKPAKTSKLAAALRILFVVSSKEMGF